MRPFRSLGTYVALFVGLAGVFLALYAWRLPPFDSSVERTNDAYVRGQVTVIAPQLAGIVAEVAVQDYETVEAGQLIARPGAPTGGVGPAASGRRHRRTPRPRRSEIGRVAAPSPLAVRASAPVPGEWPCPTSSVLRRSSRRASASEHTSAR